MSERAALAELRTYSSRQRDAEWVATGEPTCCYCAICECPKSGDAEVPNQHAECCRDDICACHTPEEEAA